MSKLPFQPRIWGGIILFVTCFIFAGYEWYTHFEPPAVPSLPPLVRVVEIAAVSEFETRLFPGIAKESQIANLSFRVAGQLIESEIKIGKKFSKNGVLARLDPRDYELAVERLKAELQSAEALFGAMKTGARPEDIATLQTQYAAAKTAFATAETNLKRFENLLADQAASQAQFDLAKTQFETAKSQKETLENELEKAQSGSRKEELASTEAKILALKANLNIAQNALNDTLLTAPFDGMIVEKFIEDHEVVASGMPIVSFIDISRIDIAVSITEEIIVRMDDIHAYQVEFESYPGHLFRAVLKEIGLAVQRGRQVYPLLVRVDLPPEVKIFPGMTAKVRIDLIQKKCPVKIPLAALIGDPKNEDHSSAVWVVEENRTVRKPVKILRFTETGVDIESGLKPSDKIVAAGARSLTEGQLVRIETVF
jgi:multidrug efflux pump subunit AcrA (membrane-fusion protein)